MISAADSAGTGSSRVRLTRLIPALGVAQIISWGTLFYSIAVLGESMRSELGLSSVALFGAFTLGLLLSGAVSPIVGRLLDARGGRFVLSWGSIIAALALAAIASAKGVVVLFLGWAVAGIAMAACLYDPAFVSLHQVSAHHYRRAVTALTLFGGFASTVFWPVSQWLLEAVGWRNALWIYSALHLSVCLPLHLFSLPRVQATRSPAMAGNDAPTPTAPPEDHVSEAKRGSYFWTAVAFSIAAFLSATLSAHLISMLKASHLTAAQAVMISSLIGPMQVAGRIAEFAFAHRLSALRTGTLAFVLMAAGMVCLTAIDGFSPLAFAFAMLYGWSNGVMTIVRGTVPAALFGRRNYGALLGRLALPAFVAKAIAPFAFASVLAVGLPVAVPLWTLVLVGALGLGAYGLAIRPPGRASGRRRVSKP